MRERISQHIQQLAQPLVRLGQGQHRWLLLESPAVPRAILAVGGERREQAHEHQRECSQGVVVVFVRLHACHSGAHSAHSAHSGEQHARPVHDAVRTAEASTPHQPSRNVSRGTENHQLADIRLLVQLFPAAGHLFPAAGQLFAAAGNRRRAAVQTVDAGVDSTCFMAWRDYIDAAAGGAAPFDIGHLNAAHCSTRLPARSRRQR